MAVRALADALAGLDHLRYEPVVTRIRARLGVVTVVDTERAVLIWEPSRLVPQYAVPVDDVRAELLPGSPEDGPSHGEPVRLATDGPMVLTPAAGFGVHTADGDVLGVVADGRERPGAGFALADPDLAGYVVLDFAAFDDWFCEGERLVSHPRDPFKRIDVWGSERHVRIERDGRVLAESDRPRLLVETHLPVRWYLPPGDVRRELFTESATVTACAYKGYARYLALDGEDLAWYYPEPLPDGLEVRDLVCFWDERVDVVVDGRRRERPRSPWS